MILGFHLRIHALSCLFCLPMPLSCRNSVLPASSRTPQVATSAWSYRSATFWSRQDRHRRYATHKRQRPFLMLLRPTRLPRPGNTGRKIPRKTLHPIRTLPVRDRTRD
ncbi:hypothetical protein BCV70DRAFT_48014 [Testicularia cyperi]|uniref:Secreted protein n=1 Tax=Testicularia cyperi TaxID=1882483 RepID=A0A317XH52_9BASI|nr:hypothetical protein BCV70DRAFT_48014 [Testicularia cyperi]